MIHHWQQQHSTHTITVDVQATGNPFHHSHIGRHQRKHPTQRTIQTSDITTIVAFALNTCIFRACNNTYKQIRGAGIGSQLSPALCNVAITLIEHSWHQIHNNLLQHTSLHFTYYRYVDNRFIVHNEHFLHHPAIQALIHHNFFGDPVELEPEALCPKRTQPPRLPPFFEKSAEDGDLCVSTPGQRVSYRQFSAPVPQAGGQRMTSRRWPTKLVMSWDAVRDV